MKQKLPFGVKQKLATFKRLQRRFKAEKTTQHLSQLCELDAFLTKNIIGWRATYSKYQ